MAVAESVAVIVTGAIGTIVGWVAQLQSSKQASPRKSGNGNGTHTGEKVLAHADGEFQGWLRAMIEQQRSHNEAQLEESAKIRETLETLGKGMESSVGAMRAIADEVVAHNALVGPAMAATFEVRKMVKDIGARLPKRKSA
jgi:hypothetical protein